MLITDLRCLCFLVRASLEPTTHARQSCCWQHPPSDQGLRHCTGAQSPCLRAAGPLPEEWLADGHWPLLQRLDLDSNTLTGVSQSAMQSFVHADLAVLLGAEGFQLRHVSECLSAGCDLP